MVIITLHDSKILLSLHYFLTPQFENFTNLLIGILGVSNPTFFLRFLRKYVTILVNISNISNNTVLQCYLLRIFVSIRRLFQLILCIGISTPPHLKNMTFSFANYPLKSSNYPSAPFWTGFSVNSHNINNFLSLTASHLLNSLLKFPSLNCYS